MKDPWCGETVASEKLAAAQNGHSQGQAFLCGLWNMVAGIVIRELGDEHGKGWSDKHACL